MTRSLRLDLPLLLPEVPDVRDRCVERLLQLVSAEPGVHSAHIALAPGADRRDGATPGAAGDAQLCLHYDPDRLSLAEVTELARLAGATVSNRFVHALIPFHGVGSEDDGVRIEEGLMDVPGVTAARVNLAAQVARVEYDTTTIGRDAIERRLRELGLQVSASPLPARGGETTETRRSESARDEEQGDAGWYAKNRELVWSLVAGSFLLAGWSVERWAALPRAMSIALFVGAYVFGARDNVGHTIKGLRRGRLRFNIDLLMVVAAIGAAILGAWAEGALLLFLFSLGHALEHYALGRARNAIRALADLAPQTAIVLVGGTEVETPIDQVKPGDLVLVKPAERIPVDGKVAKGTSGVNQAPITGESMPVTKAPDDPVFAGSVNGDGALVVDVTAALGDRTLDRVIRLVTEAQTQKAPTQQFTERFERVFVPIVLLADVALMIVPPLLGLWTWSDAFYRAMVLLVAASPCALAIGTPAAILAGIAQAARNGVLIKGGAHLETLGTIDVLALDKTGTITKGEPTVTDVRALDGATEETVLATAAAVERHSQHPLARAIELAAKERGLRVSDPSEAQSVTGRGIRARVDGRMAEVGRLLLFEDAGVEIPQNVRDTVDDLERAGRTTVVVRQAAGNASTDAQTGSAWLGVIGIADQPRPAARATLERLRKIGVRRLLMLTGDNQRVGDAVGVAVGIDEVRAALLPEDKVAIIKQLAGDGGRVAMVGDGVNDAPALAHATVGIAMGGAGTAAALETADVVLMSDDLGRLPFAIGLSRATRSVIRQNLFLSLGVIAALVLTSVLGLTSIGLAVVVHEGSTLAVVANGLRLLAFRVE